MAFLPPILLIGALDKITGRNHFLIHSLSRRLHSNHGIS